MSFPPDGLAAISMDLVRCADNRDIHGNVLLLLARDPSGGVFTAESTDIRDLKRRRHRVEARRRVSCLPVSYTNDSVADAADQRVINRLPQRELARHECR